MKNPVILIKNIFKKITKRRKHIVHWELLVFLKMIQKFRIQKIEKHYLQYFELQNSLFSFLIYV